MPLMDASIRFTPPPPSLPSSQRSSIHRLPTIKNLRIRLACPVVLVAGGAARHLPPPPSHLSPEKERRGELFHCRLPSERPLRDRKRRRRRRGAMAVPLVLVVLPLGLLFLLSGLIVNTIQVPALPTGACPARFVFLFRRPR